MSSKNLPSDEQISNIMKQAPDWATPVQISELWVEFDGNFVAIMAKLWNLPSPKKKEVTKWDEIREVCDMHDAEMDKIIKRISG